MDTFMDKLAQKLNAQQMIKANTTAELEELEQVKDQIAELKECVSRVESAADRFQEGSQTFSQQMESLNVRSEDQKPLEVTADDNDVIYILEEEVSQLSEEFADFKKSLNGYDDSFADVKSNFAGIGQNFTEIRGNLAENTAAVRAAAEAAASQTENLQSAAETVQNRVGDVQTAVEAMQSRLGDVQTTAEAVQSQLGDVRTAAEAMQSRVGDTHMAVDRLDSKMDQVQEEISELDEKIGQDFAQHKADVEALGNAIENAIIGVQNEMTRMMEAQNGDEDLLQDLRKELDVLAERLTQANVNSVTRNAETMDALKRFLIERMEALKPDPAALEEQKAVVQEQKAVIEELKASQEADKAEMEKKLTGIHESLRDGYHKECVKVYRNVQAAFNETNEVQTSQISELLDKMRGKYRLAIILSGMAFGTALVGVVLQILGLLHIL